MHKKKDVMFSILIGHGDEFEARVEELNSLIYKNDKTFQYEMTEGQNGEIWQASKENVSVQVWEGKAKIKVRVSSGNKKSISIKRIAEIAVNAILEELKKEV